MDKNKATPIAAQIVYHNGERKELTVFRAKNGVCRAYADASFPKVYRVSGTHVWGTDLNEVIQWRDGTKRPYREGAYISGKSKYVLLQLVDNRYGDVVERLFTEEDWNTLEQVYEYLNCLKATCSITWGF